MIKFKLTIFSCFLSLCLLTNYKSVAQINYLVALNLRTNITVSDPNPVPVQTVIYFNPNASDGFNSSFDVPYFPGTGSGIWSYIGSTSVSINVQGDFTYDRIIRLGVTFPTNPGACRFSASDNPEFIGTSNLILEDTLLNIFHDLRANPDYNVNLSAGTYLNRFKLHLGPSATASYTSNCFSSFLHLYNYSSLPVSYSVVDSTSNVVSAGTEFTSDSSSIPVEPGEYFVTYSRGIYSFIDTVLVLPSDLALSGSLSASTNIVDVVNNTPVNFNLDLSGSFDSIVWNFGDASSEFNLTNVNHTYTEQGEYTVSASIFNDSCSLVLETPITVSNTTTTINLIEHKLELKILENKAFEITNLGNSCNGSLNIYSFDGKLIYSNFLILNQNSKQIVSLKDSLQNGVYFVQIKSNEIEQIKKIIAFDN
jgi:PKD repeat protein